MNEVSGSDTIRWIPLVPLLAAFAQALSLVVLRRSTSRAAVVAFSCGAALLALVLTSVAFWELLGVQGDRPALVDRVYTWVGVGIGENSFTADLAFQLDPLSGVMALVVTGVMAIGQFYTAGFMRDDPRDDGGLQRFYCYLNLFSFAMLVLVLADNLLLFFLGWELAAVCSYLMIAFWVSEPAGARASNRAFIIDRIGAVALLLGSLLLFWSLASIGEASLSFRSIDATISRISTLLLPAPEWLGGSVGLLVAIGVCFFVAACARSAQGPMMAWLPESMVAPTPASALIHSALGVAAGVYLLCRLSSLFALTPELGAWIAWTGGLTALVAAAVAMVQTDLKQVLAYATASQLGLMFVAVGCGAYGAAIFHATTHAFFASLLFMSGGAVILAMNREQDMRKMGGLRAKLIRVHLVAAAGVAAAVGLPLTSGFLSRHEILLSFEAAEGLPGNSLLYACTLLTVACLTFALSRFLFMIFYGQSRLPARMRTDMEDPGRTIIVPLYLLAGFAIFGGLLGLPQFWGDMLDVEDSNSLGNFVAAMLLGAPLIVDEGRQWALVASSSVMSLTGFFVALQLYVRRPEIPGRLLARLSGVHEMLTSNFRLSEAYDRLVAGPLLRASDRVLFGLVERHLIDRWLVSGSALALRRVLSRLFASDREKPVQAYSFTILIGALTLVGFLLL